MKKIAVSRWVRRACHDHRDEDPEFSSSGERKNFSATAVATHISQQALSAQIASLEEDLGFALFIRNTKRVELTEAGERIRALWGEAVRRPGNYSVCTVPRRRVS